MDLNQKSTVNDSKHLNISVGELKKVLKNSDMSFNEFQARLVQVKMENFKSE